MARPCGRAVRLTVRAPGDVLPASARLVEICLRFGVPMTVPGRTIASGLALRFEPGSVTLISGPSGSGKSMLLGEIAKHFPTSRLVNNIQFPLDVSVVDAVAPTRPIGEALGLLTACGLGEPMLWIRRFNQLSDGERFRARLARAVSLHRGHTGGLSGGAAAGMPVVVPLLCDEFGAILHRRLAKALALNLRKLVSRERLALVVATSQDDLEQDLQPDCVVRLGGSPPVVEERARDQRPPARGAMISFARRLRIERGTMRDYAHFASMHYRQRHQVGFVDRVFVLREGLGGPLLGIVVYGRAALELARRNEATCGRFVRRPDRLNRELRVLKRLVIHPDVRGCGLGHWLVRETLPLAGTAFVECLAAMGAVNPVFDKAGMRRVGLCDSPPKRDHCLAELRQMGADPLSADFVSQVCRRPAVRRRVAASVLDWYRTTTIAGVGESRLMTRSPSALAQTYRQLAGSRPVYFIWARDADGRELIERGLRRGEHGE